MLIAQNPQDILRKSKVSSPLRELTYLLRRLGHLDFGKTCLQAMEEWAGKGNRRLDAIARIQLWNAL